MASMHDLLARETSRMSLTSPTSPTDLPAALKFTQFVHDKQLQGRNGDLEPRPFVPFSRLQEYWTLSRIREIIDGCNITIRADAIRERYLRIFSTLVYIDHVSCLTEFTENRLEDSRFPFDARPTCWPDAPRHGKMWESFSVDQVSFLPLKWNFAIVSNCAFVLRKRFSSWSTTR
jgi:hypothetical protein